MSLLGANRSTHAVPVKLLSVLLLTFGKIGHSERGLRISCIQTLQLVSLDSLSLVISSISPTFSPLATVFTSLFLEHPITAGYTMIASITTRIANGTTITSLPPNEPGPFVFMFNLKSLIIELFPQCNILFLSRFHLGIALLGLG